MHNSASKQLRLALASVALNLFVACPAHAADDEFSRSGKTDIYGVGQYLNGNNFEGYSGGFGVSYHFNDFVAVNTEGTAGALRGERHGALYSGLASV